MRGVQAAGLSPVPITAELWREFRVPANDQKGHHERFWANCPPGMHGQVNTIIASKLFPYRSQSDLLRHAVWRHLKWLDMMAGEPVSSVTAQVDAILEIVKEEEFQADFQDVIDQTGQMVNRLMGSGDTDEAKRMLVLIRGQIDAMPEGHWKRRYQAEFDQRWGYSLGIHSNGKTTGAVIDESGEIVEFRPAGEGG